ncbi:SCO family protein [Pararobbsia silviterrae]|uniref:SCO family protein n=1 Tax=Pararobbsia silviterrae TaxID=1792498 RepID=A0A494Y4K7_9BURK|nr:SCO family protein [Pararobbsia silviterrae]RKP56433.1 SCO family protein [Pararobbsia silviterrae]
MQHPIQHARRASFAVRGAVLGILMSLMLAGCGKHPESWMLENVDGHLPDLEFTLTNDAGKPETAADLKGKIAIVYFGYTHCPDICPQTMANLTQAVAKVGDAADEIRIVFISVDPARDTPESMHAYVDAFDARHAIGLTGSPAAIETLAKRYRVAYQADAPASGGNYEVSHSSGIYIFDRDGRARLLANGTDTIDALAHDLRQLAQQR